MTTARFRLQYTAADPRRQAQIRRAYGLWLEDPSHPSVRFKKVHATRPIYSARVDLDWRALCVLEGDTAVWFWVGSHREYEALMRRLA